MVVEKYEIEVMIDLDGKYVLTATGRVFGAQPFWFSDYRYDSYAEALSSPDLHSPRGPVH
jgi:hypothetical protein